MRKELEAKYGIKGGGRTGTIVKALGVVALLAVAFVGGRGFGPGGWSWDRASGAADAGTAAAAQAKAAGPGDVDKMLDTVGTKGPAGGGAAAGADPVAGAVGDPEIDDELMQSFGGKRVGGKGLTIEQAVAASKTLAKSVGNTTAERALAGGAAGGAGGAKAGAGATAAAGEASSAAGAAGAGAAAAGTASGSESALPMRTRVQLSLEMARQLAEMKQLPRALAVLRALKANPAVAADAAALATIRVAELEVRAWAISSVQGADVRKALDGLLAGVNEVPDAADKVRVLSRMGVTLSRLEQLPPEAGRAFLTQAGEVIKSVSDAPQRNLLTGEWAVALGEVMASEVAARARSGAWGKAQAAAGQIESLIKQAPDAAAQARLHAIDYHVKEQLGQQDEAAQSLATGLALAGKVASVPDRAALLRAMANLSVAAANDKLQAAQTTLQSQAMARPPLERAQALAQLALLNADAGLRGKSGELRQLALATPGLSPADVQTIQTDLTARSDLASAKVLHGVGLYAESESILQRLAGFLS